MAELQLGGKTIATQTGTAEPVIASNVDTSDATFPNFVGMIVAFAMSTPPTGWLACQGQTLDANTDTAYTALFNAIGTTWGGTGKSSFLLPDLRGTFLRGTGTGVINGVNKVGGTVGQFQVDEMTRHTGHFSAASPGHMGNVSIFEGVGSPSVSGTQSALSGANQGNSQRFQNTSGAAANGYSKLVIDIGDGDETRPYNASIQFCIRWK